MRGHPSAPRLPRRFWTAKGRLTPQKGFVVKKLLVVLMFLTPSMLFAQNAFNGTWRFDMQSGQIGGKPFIQSLHHGMYHCNCVPEITTQADGKDHERKGSPYSDTINIREIDDHTIEVVTKKDGKTVSRSKDTASEDGSTLKTEWTAWENGHETNGAHISKRVAPAPAGANKTSGSWQFEKVESASDNMTAVTFSATPERLSMTVGLGDSYTAKFDGKDYPYNGDPGTTSVSLRRIDDHTIEQTDKRDGKITSVRRMTVSSDGKTLTLDVEDKQDGTTAKWTAHKE